MAPNVFIGIDVSKQRLDVALRPTGAKWSVANDAAGVALLVERVRALAPVALIVMEATGGYEMAVAAALTAAATLIARRFVSRLTGDEELPDS